MRRHLSCPKCRSENLRMKKGKGLERVLIWFTRKRKYQCATCDFSFRAPDRRRYPRGGDDVAGAIESTHHHK